jgi:hypothetical protein
LNYRQQGRRATIREFKKEDYFSLNPIYGSATRISYRALRTAIHDLV